MRGNGKTTQFGQTLIASDYGADDLWRYRDDLPVDTGLALARTDNTRPEEANMQMIALLDEEAPAKVTRYQTREPDFFEDGRAYWIGADGVVSVRIEDLRAFRIYVASRCMAPIGRTIEGWSVVMHAEDAEHGLNTLIDTCR